MRNLLACTWRAVSDVARVVTIIAVASLVVWLLVTFASGVWIALGERAPGVMAWFAPLGAWLWAQCERVYGSIGLYASLAVAVSIAGVFYLFAWADYRASGPHPSLACGAVSVLGTALLLSGLYGISLLLWEGLAATTAFSPVDARVMANEIMTAVDAIGGWLAWLSTRVDVFGVVLIVLTIVALAALVVIVAVALAGAWINERIATLQDRVYSLLVSEVNPAFPRQSPAIAQARMRDRLAAIDEFLAKRKVPPLHTETHFTAAPAKRTIREYVERRQEIEDEKPPPTAPEFLEFPPGSPLMVKPVCLTGYEEIAGQVVRLKFETEQPHRERSWWERVKEPDRPDELLIALMARVVDAAILADRHFDAQRKEKRWKAMPFFERIYVEYRPMPFPLGCFLRALIGNAMPARVVIETYYPDVFTKALFGEGKQKAERYAAKWFGIGIQIEPPNLTHSLDERLRRRWGCKTKPVRAVRATWTPAQPLCRRNKAHLAGVLSGVLKVRFTTNPTSASDEQFHIMPSGPLADGCPSVLMPDLMLRGSVANAPPGWLFPPLADLKPDCAGYCMLAAPKGEAKVEINPEDFPKTRMAAGDMPRRYWGPKGRLHDLERKVWVGAFFDNDLRQGNRFPLAACRLRSEGGRARRRTDFRGAFVTPRGSENFGGVVLSAYGPERASSLLLPESLLYDYLNHLGQRDRLMKLMPPCEGPPFVPKPEKALSR